MAAYAALLSLNSIINQLQQHPRPPISMDQNQVQSLNQNITFLQDFLEVYSHVFNEDVDQYLQSCIAQAAYAAEGVIESHIVDQILAESTTHGEQISSVDFYQGLQKVIEDMDIIKKEVMEIKKKMGSVQDIQQHGRSSVRASFSSVSSSTGRNTVVGVDKVSEEIMDKLTRGESNLQIIPIVGMGGIGKTTLAKTVYENPLIVQRFDIRGWATISQKYSVKEILFELLRDRGSQESSSQMSEAKLGHKLYQTLYGRRFLIIMDDLWSIRAWDELKMFFPENHCGSGIIITSRLSNLASDISAPSSLQMSFLNDDKSWELFCKTVFGEDGCPLELEEIGKKIAKKCKGLPLSLVVIGGLLKKFEQTREYWEVIAKNLNSFVNLEGNERCLKLLHMSYDYLPIHLKPCFLYMGVFNEDAKISVSELIKLWVAEGFLKPISGKSLEEVAEEYLKVLVDRNLILVDRWKHNGKIKLCKMHDLLRDLCLREAEKDKFLWATRLESLNNFPQDINTQRRIAIHRGHRGDLWKEKDECYLPEIRDTLQSAQLARSLIFVSLKILPSCNFKLSRILKAFDSGGNNHSIDSPFQLVNLRYLAIAASFISLGSCTIPSSVYLLWNLQTLVVNHVYTNDVDIWKMPLLRHVKLKQFSLNDPEQDDFVLGNLQTLSDIKNFKFSEEAIKRIPNIKKLKMGYGMYANEISHYCLNNVGRLQKLESLNISIAPGLGSAQNLTFPHSIKKLTLSSKGSLHWGDMSTMIGSLPHLQVLRISGYFNGPEWETIEGQFLSLKFLNIQFGELECWTTEASHFPCLEHLVLYYLRNLKAIPSCLGDIPTLELIEIDGCSNAAVVSAEEIAEEQYNLGNEDLRVRVHDRYEMPYEELQRMASHNLLLGIVFDLAIIFFLSFFSPCFGFLFGFFISYFLF